MGLKKFIVLWLLKLKISFKVFPLSFAELVNLGDRKLAFCHLVKDCSSDKLHLFISISQVPCFLGRAKINYCHRLSLIVV